MALLGYEEHFLHHLHHDSSPALDRVSNMGRHDGVRQEINPGYDGDMHHTAPSAYLIPRKPLHDPRQPFNVAGTFVDYADLTHHGEAVEVPFAARMNSDSDNMRGWTAANRSTQKLLVATQAVHRREKRSSLRQDWWLYEIGGAVLSFVCLVAIIIVLYRFHGQPLAAWKMPIALNSLISLFSTIAKAALLLPVAACISQLKWHYFAEKPHALNELQVFDEASRGPLGALQLLWELKTNALFASFASVITIVALAMDPFTQQIISFPSLSVPTSTASATMAMAQIYDTGLSQDIRNILCRLSISPRARLPGTTLPFGPYVTLDQYSSRCGRALQVRAALLISSLVKAISTDVTMQGAIFNGIYTLGSRFPFVCTSGNCEWEPFASLGVCGECANHSHTSKWTVSCHTLDTNKTVSIAPDKNAPKVCYYELPGQTELVAFTGMGGAGSYATIINMTAVAFENTNTSNIMAFMMIRFPGAGASFALPDPEVHECLLWWCPKYYYNVTISNGSMTPGTVVEGSFDDVSTTWSNGNWDGVDPGYQVFTAPDPGNVASFNKSFTVNVRDNANTGQYLQSLFTTSQLSGNAYTDLTGYVNIANALYHAQNITDTVSRIATSMTNRVRLGQNSTAAYGITYQDVTFIRVRWIWLSLPALVVLLANALLLVSILLNRRRRTVLWKSSSLALLFHGLEGWHRDELEGDKASQIESDARSMRAQLQRNPNEDLRFVRC